jgi:hypothetical protein
VAIKATTERPRSPSGAATGGGRHLAKYFAAELEVSSLEQLSSIRSKARGMKTTDITKFKNTPGLPDGFCSLGVLCITHC